jgi:taurine--2-oxoglutarate transaminase
VRIPEPNDDEDGSKTLEIVKKTGSHLIAAICIETISGANGAECYGAKWWSNVIPQLKKMGIKIILDEVVCGFGRTGKNFGFHHFNITPDFITMAKAISAGIIPFGAIWTSEEIVNYYQNNLLSGGLTQYANPSGLAAMNAVIDFIQNPDFAKKSSQLLNLHQQFHAQLNQMSFVKTTRLHGHLMAIELKKTIDWSTFLNEGLYFISKENMCVLAPALNYNPNDLQQGYQRFLEILQKVAK